MKYAKFHRKLSRPQSILKWKENFPADVSHPSPLLLPRSYIKRWKEKSFSRKWSDLVRVFNTNALLKVHNDDFSPRIFHVVSLQGSNAFFHSRVNAGGNIVYGEVWANRKERKLMKQLNNWVRRSFVCGTFENEKLRESRGTTTLQDRIALMLGRNCFHFKISMFLNVVGGIFARSFKAFAAFVKSFQVFFSYVKKIHTFKTFFSKVFEFSS